MSEIDYESIFAKLTPAQHRMMVFQGPGKFGGYHPTVIRKLSELGLLVKTGDAPWQWEVPIHIHMHYCFWDERRSAKP